MQDLNLGNGYDDGAARGKAYQGVLKDMPKSPQVDYSHMINVISSWVSILNARLLALLTLFGTLTGFTFTMYDPTPLRLWAMAIYAILCQGPILALYLRKG